MCCAHGSHHSHHHGESCGCSGHESHHGASRYCGGHFHPGPFFWTKAEKIAWLEEVLAGLQEETKAVEGRIAALKGEE